MGGHHHRGLLSEPWPSDSSGDAIQVAAVGCRDAIKSASAAREEIKRTAEHVNGEANGSAAAAPVAWT